MRSSRPTKSPYVTDSPSHVESPRLWYSVVSLSQAGTLRFASSGLTVGVYGKLVAASSAGNGSAPAPAYSARSISLPSASR